MTRQLLLTCAVLLAAGCSSAPFVQPKAVPVFTTREAGELTPEKKAEAASGDLKDFALVMATNADDSATAMIRMDSLAGITLAAIGFGALTDANSDFYKGSGALLGLTLGTRQYLQPAAQQAVYLNAADVASCSAVQLSSIAASLTGVSFDNISSEETRLAQYHAKLKSAVYSQTFASSGINPFAAATLLTAATNAEEDQKAAREVFKFIRQLDAVVLQRKVAIYKYTVGEINKTSYKLDESLKTITRLSVSPANLGTALQVAQEKGLILAIEGEEGSETKLAPRLPEITDSINAFIACGEILKP